MITCSICKTENLDEAKYCSNCSAPLSSSVESDKPVEADDKLDFVVTETADTAAPNFLNTAKKPEDPEDKLEITPAANILEEHGSEEIKFEDNAAIEANQGITRPFDEAPAEKDQMAKESKEEKEHKKLSDKELDNIRRNMYGSDSINDKSKGAKEPHGLTKPRPEKKKNKNKPLADKPSEKVKQLDDPALAPGSVKQASKTRGLALFRNNSIKLVGNPFLHAGDEISINNKYYVLKPKQIDKKMVFGAVGALAAILLIIIGVAIINKPALSGDGELIGMILDSNGQPYLEGARVSIPLLSKTTTTNAQGFFHFELIPTGTYEILYELNDDFYGQGNATVTSEQMTIMTFGDLSRATNKTVYNPEPPRSTIKTTEVVQKPTTPPPSKSEKKKSSDSSNKKSNSSYGKIKLDANVENARLTVDGEVLGAGNNTYSKIDKGSHNIKVDKPGYSEYSEKITVKSGQTVTINPNLKRINDTPKELTADNYLTRSKDAFAAGNYDDALSDINKALELDPASINAYQLRANIYKKTGENDKVAADYLRLGEMYRFKKNYDKAIDAFGSALNYEPKNISALVGRGGSYMEQGNFKSGLNDYENAIRTNDNFYPAQYGMGVCYFKMGEYKRAEKYLKNAYKLNSEDPYLHQYLMLNYLARDNVSKVRSTYAEFKILADPQMLAEVKSSSRFQPVLRLIKEEDR